MEKCKICAGWHRSGDDGFYYISPTTGARYDIGELYTIGARRLYTHNLLVINKETPNGYQFIDYLAGADDFPCNDMILEIQRQIANHELPHNENPS